MDTVEIIEVDSQEYQGNNAVFSSGLVFGQEPDVIYFRWQRDGDGPHTLLLRPDEAARIAGLIANAVWSWEVRKLLPDSFEPENSR